MKKTKRIISMILAVMMLSMTAIGVNAEELIVGFDDLLEVVGIIEHDHEELQPIAVTMTCGTSCNCKEVLSITYNKIPLTEGTSYCGLCGSIVVSNLYEMICNSCYKSIGKVRKTDCGHFAP